MNNKGFVFLETIITVVVLMSTLVLLYATYSNVITTEQSRLYHDDIAYVYKTKHIRDAFERSVDYAKFNDAVNRKLLEAGNGERMYIYVFNIESDIYSNNKIISQAKELYGFYRLVYVKISDIDDIKRCVKKGTVAAPSTVEEYKCNTTLMFAESHGFNYLKDYFLTLDVPAATDGEGNAIEGIMISMIYEAKNGDIQQDSTGVITVGQGKYSECLYEKVGSHYNIAKPAESASAAVKAAYETQMENAMKNYLNDDKLSFNMACERAYYLSWVYLW